MSEEVRTKENGLVGKRVVIMMRQSLYHGYIGTVTSVTEDGRAWVDVEAIPGRYVRPVLYPVDQLKETKRNV